ncbi:hypothetical protein HRG_004079 [Hirsutella rhossiliensis]|uniref:Uncharacterized protein n=1 Tax=Hirsutella rhossiliensis TaxID=111463 RepID=A0A9P8SK80_9HYPO|nr:uncharacterized protein HRG_04079 [Hirsutella rhossiliensis]KAH0966063.1 hypothetical protein HRG_04079 [Hirsutella rhossiliensis]
MLPEAVIAGRAEHAGCRQQRCNPGHGRNRSRLLGHIVDTSCDGGAKAMAANSIGGRHAARSPDSPIRRVEWLLDSKRGVLRPIYPNLDLSNGRKIDTHARGTIGRIDPPPSFQHTGQPESLDDVLKQALSLETRFEVPLPPTLRRACRKNTTLSVDNLGPGGNPPSAYESCKRRRIQPDETDMDSDDHQRQATPAASQAEAQQPCDTSSSGRGSSATWTHLVETAKASTRTSLFTTPSVCRATVCLLPCLMQENTPSRCNSPADVALQATSSKSPGDAEDDTKAPSNLSHQGVSTDNQDSRNPPLDSATTSSAFAAKLARYSTDSMAVPSKLSVDDSSSHSLMDDFNSVSVSMKSGSWATFEWTRPWKRNIIYELGAWLCPHCERELTQAEGLADSFERMPGFPIQQRKCLNCRKQEFCKIFECFL